MTWESLMEIGIGQMGMSPDEFWEMTPIEFYTKQKGFFEHFTFCQEEEWKRTIAQINVHLPKNKKIKMPTRKQGEKPRLPTREETIALDKKWR